MPHIVAISAHTSEVVGPKKQCVNGGRKATVTATQHGIRKPNPATHARAKTIPRSWTAPENGRDLCLSHPPDTCVALWRAPRHMLQRSTRTKSGDVMKDQWSICKQLRFANHGHAMIRRLAQRQTAKPKATARDHKWACLSWVVLVTWTSDMRHAVQSTWVAPVTTCQDSIIQP